MNFGRGEVAERLQCMSDLGLSQNSNETNNNTLNTRTRGTLLQRSTLQPRISLDIKRKRKRSDSVL